jgi:gluconate 2-dehydrogenase gamma chain
MERILPGGDGPGATDAHAVGYADWLVGHPQFASVRAVLSTGLALVETLAVSTAGKPFPECGPREQDEVLRRVQQTPHPTVQRFFVLLVRLTIDGFLGAPRYGGNRNRVGWEYIGFMPHHLTVDAPLSQAQS